MESNASSGRTFQSLSPRERAIVAIAVLLDGREAEIYLEGDKEKGNALCVAAQEVAMLPPEMRMPLIGGYLRTALAELRRVL